MYRRVIFIVFAAIVALCCGLGCNQQQVADLTAKVSSKDSIIGALRADSIITHDNLLRTSTDANQKKAIVDSLSKITLAQREEIARLKNAMTQQKVEFDSTYASCQTKQIASEKALAECTKKAEFLGGELNKSAASLGDIKQQVDQLQEKNRIALEWLQYDEHKLNHKRGKIELPKDPNPIVEPAKKK